MPSFLSRPRRKLLCTNRSPRCNHSDGAQQEASKVTLANPSLQQMRDELHVGEEFLVRYNRPGPRYTSYPTAPVWNEAFGPDDLEKVHAKAEKAGTPVSLYMHIPFCESLCLFCACNVVIQKD